MMKRVFMSQKAFQATLHLLNCSGKWLLPKETRTADKGASAFLAGREELCRNGWAELDFDGSVLPAQEFMRLVHGLTCLDGSMRVELPEKTQWYLRTPIEMLFLEQDVFGVHLEQRRGRSAMLWARDTVFSAEKGCLTTQGQAKILQTELSQTKAGSRDRAEELANHLCLFFGEEGKHA